MEDMAQILSALKLLISTSGSSTDETETSKEAPLVQQLRANLKSYQAALSDTKYRELSKHIDSIQFTSESCAGSTTLPVYLNFVRVSLCLMSILDNTLQTLDKKDIEEKKCKSIHPPPPPRALLSISDIKSVHSLLQFVVSLGIYPYLFPGIDNLLQMRLAHAQSVEKMSQVSAQAKSFLLYECAKVLMGLFENPVLGPSVLSKHLPDVLAALIQICYAPSTTREGTSFTNEQRGSHSCKEKESSHATPTLTTPGDIGHQSKLTSSLPTATENPPNPSSQATLINSSRDLKEITVSQVDECLEMLHKLLKQTYQPLVIRELLTLQGLSSKQLSSGQRKKLSGLSKRTASTQSHRWILKACGQLLSERLMDKNGVQNTLKGIYDSAASGRGESWKKCQAVAKVIASCPAQASSVEEYYSLVCPQVLSLLHSTQVGVANEFVRVAIATVSMMLTEQEDLATKYLIEPLMSPLLQICTDSSKEVAGHEALGTCIVDLHKICCTVEPSSPLLTALQPYLPLLFELWLADREREKCTTSLQAKEILSRVLKTADFNTALQCLCFISRFQPSQVRAHFQFKSIHPTVSLVPTTVDNHQVLTVRTLTEEDVLEHQNAQEMERVGNGVVALLRSEQQEWMIGSFFLLCLQHLTSVISHQVGNRSTPEHLQKEEQTVGGSHPTSTSGDHPTLEDSAISTTLESAQDASPMFQTRSSALLECESKLPPSHSEAYSNSLVLYITAAMCEELSATLLQQAKLPDLLSTISALVSCHAKYSKDVSKDASELIVSEETSKEILAGPITLSIVFGLLSAILSGAVEVDRQHRPLLAQLQPSLVTIASSYPNEELASLANDLHICIATLGAVWSSETRDRAADQVSSSREGILSQMKNTTPSPGYSQRKPSFTNTAQNTHHTEVVASESHSQKQSRKTHVNAPIKELSATESKLTSFQQAMLEVRDPLLPVKGHGLISLTKLVLSNNKEALSDLPSLLTLFREHLKHDDSYIYLAAINGLVSLASIPDVRSSVVSSLCQGYSQLAGPPSRQAASLVNLETGQLKQSVPFVSGNDNISSHTSTGEQLPPSKSKSAQPARVHSDSPQMKLSIQVRMKLGEALIKVARSCGDMLPKYLDEITAAIFSNVNDPEPLIRASSLSNLADICAGVKFSFSRIHSEVLSCVASILQSELEVKVRQAALVVLKQTIKGLSHDAIQILGGSLHEIYQLLKHVESSDKDELTRAHAQAALGELDSVMRDYLFPEQSRELTKKISILDVT